MHVAIATDVIYTCACSYNWYADYLVYK